MLIKDILYHAPKKLTEDTSSDNLVGGRFIYEVPPLNPPIEQYVGYLEIPVSPKAEEKLQVNFFGLTKKTPKINLTVLPPVVEEQHVDILRVRLESGFDDPIQHIDYAEKSVNRSETYASIKLIKQLPGFVNYDSITDEEFKSRYGRVKTSEDKGLIGYLFIGKQNRKRLTSPSEPPSGGKITPSPSQSKNSSSSDNDPPKSKKPKPTFVPDREQTDRDSKRKQAVKIYKANRNVRRKEVVKLIAKRLNMTVNGASSYYTFAKNFVEKGIKD